MALEVKLSETNGVILAELFGVLDIAAASRLEAAAHRWAERSNSRVVIDLSGADQIFAGGLAGLVGVHRVLARTGGRVVFVSSRRFGREILRLTRVDGLITVVSDYEAAWKWFAAAKLQAVAPAAGPVVEGARTGAPR